MEGSDGMRRMQRLMDELRENPPSTLGRIKTTWLRDYLHGLRIRPGGESSPLVGPTDNLIMLDTETAGNYVAARPSGTEPKVKFYLFSYLPPEEIGDLGEARQQLERRLAEFAADLKDLAQKV
jgi:phosphoglucomutase/phosphomannomutase